MTVLSMLEYTGHEAIYVCVMDIVFYIKSAEPSSLQTSLLE